MTSWNLLALFGPLTSLTPPLLHHRCYVDPAGLEWMCLRGGIRRLGVRGRHISGKGEEAALGPPQPLLEEGHVLILLLQPSLGGGEVRCAVQLVLGGREICLEDHPVAFDGCVLIGG
jgi:hypothetical protein